MDTATVAKFNMIEQQLRPWEVLDRNVLSAIDQLDRENFVPEIYKGLAYADCQIPLDNASSMFPPIVEGRLLQSLLIDTDDDILEIGTGSGYVTACLAMLGKRVLSLDIDTVCQQSAATIFKTMRLDNIELEQLDVFTCQYDEAFNAIAVTGSVSSVPENLKTALKVGGRLFVIVGESPAMQAMLITRASTNEWITESLFETDLPALII